MPKDWDDLEWEEEEESDEVAEAVIHECELLALSIKSVKVKYDSIVEWLPLSKIKFFDEPEEGEIVRIEMPIWLSEKKEFTFAD